MIQASKQVLSSPIQRKAIQFNPTEHKEREAGEPRIQASLPMIDCPDSQKPKIRGRRQNEGWEDEKERMCFGWRMEAQKRARL